MDFSLETQIGITFGLVTLAFVFVLYLVAKEKHAAQSQQKRDFGDDGLNFKQETGLISIGDGIELTNTECSGSELQSDLDKLSFMANPEALPQKGEDITQLIRVGMSGRLEVGDAFFNDLTEEVRIVESIDGNKITYVYGLDNSTRLISTQTDKLSQLAFDGILGTYLGKFHK